MFLFELQQQLHPLSKGDKLKVIRFLVDDLAQEETDAAQAWRQLEGAYRDKMSTVDEFIHWKEEEKRLER